MLSRINFRAQPTRTRTTTTATTTTATTTPLRVASNVSSNAIRFAPGFFSVGVSGGERAPLVGSQQLQNNLWGCCTARSFIQRRQFSGSEDLIPVKVPSMGDSITDGTVGELTKKVGDSVEVDEVLMIIETSKINHEIRAPKAGVVKEILVKVGDTVLVDQVVSKVAAGAAPAASKKEAKAEEKPKETSQEKPKETSHSTSTVPPPPSKSSTPPPPPSSASSAPQVPKSASQQPVKPLQPVTPKRPAERSERREPMSRMRQTIAKNMKDSQNTLAMLTTFQEADLSELTQLRNQHKDEFEAKHGVKLGFMSCFVKAAAAALAENPAVNALIDGKEIVYRNNIDISVAVATPKGLVVPVLRNVDQMSFADIEKQIAYLGQKARNGAITLEDITGGTFTISNGGVYGSLMGTPIINPGQSAILGMHGIFERAVVVNKQVVARPMMYLALTYDHRLIDGRDAVTFLKKIKASVEDPRRLLLD